MTDAAAARSAGDLPGGSCRPSPLTWAVSGPLGSCRGAAPSFTHRGSQEHVERPAHSESSRAHGGHGRRARRREGSEQSGGLRTGLEGGCQRPVFQEQPPSTLAQHAWARPNSSDSGPLSEALQPLPSYLRLLSGLLVCLDTGA